MLLYVAITTMLFMILACNVSIVLASVFPIILTAVLVSYFAYQAMILPEFLLEYVDKFVYKIEEFKDDDQIKREMWRKSITEEDIAASLKQINDENENIFADTPRTDEDDQATDECEQENDEDQQRGDDKHKDFGSHKTLNGSGSPKLVEVELPDWLDNSALDIFVQQQDCDLLNQLDNPQTIQSIQMDLENQMMCGEQSVLVYRDDSAQKEWSVKNYSVDQQDVDDQEEEA